MNLFEFSESLKIDTRIFIETSDGMAELLTDYSPKADKSFITLDYENPELIKLVGFYFGEPNQALSYSIYKEWEKTHK